MNIRKRREFGLVDATHRFEARPSDAEMAAVAAEYAVEPVFA